ncbi:Ig-like domain-containing protein [uncultured Roseobacter sp.]|uniref:Ig-like domain-containing protein n=1 Tax=uncultured Roseobacter sp. TaxID=114847 RepID=UPI00261653D4|nr:Ig-like domain-containing protein [uncultured Roseobacter sp.]
MSLFHEAQNEDPDEVVTLWGNASDAVVVPDSALLFNGEFFRLGPDLYIVNDGAANFRVPDYFAQSKPADLHDPNGAVLRGDLVELLAGPIAPGQYAQAGDATASSPIGQVETVEGATSVQRVDGSVETLQVGSKIYQNDVIATSKDASVSVTFVDGTIFTLSASSRMVIDELIYDPDATDNSGSFSLIQGSFVFIAGQVAKTGGMDVNTPSSTMGIRGTTVVVEVGTVNGVDTTEVTLTTDPDGDTGRVELRDIDGNLVAFIDQTNTKWIVSAATGETREVDRTLQDDAEDNLLIAEAFAAFRSAVARVDAGDTFVSLSDPGSGISIDPQNQSQSPADLEVDSLDEPGAVEAPADVDDQEAPESEPFDEGLLAPEEAGPVVVVSGPEDAGGEEAISGDIAVPGSAAGTVFALAGGPSNGTVVVTADGQFDYVPNPNFNGTDSFTFAATDPNGDTVEGSVIVQVLPVNDIPDAQDAEATGVEDSILTGTIVASDIDGDVLSYAIGTTPGNGEVALFPDGTYSYRPDVNFAGTDSFSVIVSDPSGETAEATVSINITGENDAPIITTAVGANLGTVVEGDEQADARGQLSADDPEDNAVTWTGTSTALFGAFAITSTGAWTYVLDNDVADSIAEGETVTETFTATASDEFGATVTQIVEVTLTGTNDAPTVTQNSVFETDQNGVLSNQLTATDVDSSGPLSFALGDDGPENGIATVNEDGSFTYTPNADFAGIDRFSYTVTDAQGGVSTGRVTAAVESTSGAVGEQSVSVAITVDATAETAAGAVAIDAQTVEAQSVNLIIAMDSSASIEGGNWIAQREAVRDAIEQLSDQFEGSTTSVDVQVIAYSNRVVAVGPTDLHDPDLPGDILSLRFQRGSTGWDLALDEANAFLTGEPAGEANFLLFITDGVPSNGAWRQSLEALTNPPGGAFTVDIKAFGIGEEYDPTLLQEIDPDPTLLLTADDLAAALTQTPVFSPKLISLDVSLEADGEDHGTIATQDSDALIVEGIDYELPLASIENIELLLGESNRISVATRFDLDGDDSTAEIELFSSDVIGKADTAQSIAGLDAADLLFGSDLADDIAGGAGSDLILGFDGADTLDGGADADIVLAGGGDDVLRVSEAPGAGVELLDGGAGRDVLEIGVGGNLTDDLIPSLDIRDIEAIDMENGQANSLALTLEDVIDMSSTSDSQLEALLDAALPESAVIYGDATDSLTLVSGPEGGFQKVSDTPVADGNGNTLDIYAYVEGGNVLATLGVDSDIDVSGAVPVG